MRQVAFHCLKNQDWTYGKLRGIKDMSIFMELTSVDFPRSFALDAMHLFWENIASLMFDHWRGKFGNPAEPATEQNRSKARKAAKQPKFQETNDAYCIRKAEWNEIGADITASKKTLPASSGEASRNIVGHCHHYKAIEWQNWTLLLAPIMLKDLQPPAIYNAFMKLTSAFTLAMDIYITEEDIQGMRQAIKSFLVHYEKEYYRFKWDRLSYCTSQIHYLAHVADTIDTLGK